MELNCSVAFFQTVTYMHKSKCLICLLGPVSEISETWYSICVLYSQISIVLDSVSDISETYKCYIVDRMSQL